jgi:hypothetical protein
MKLIRILAVAALPLTLLAEPPTTEDSAQTTNLEWGMQKAVIESPSVAYDKIVSGEITYSGIGVQLIQAEQPLQLLNPFAPPAYGNGQQNLSADPVTKQSVGLKFFAINF